MSAQREEFPDVTWNDVLPTLALLEDVPPPRWLADQVDPADGADIAVRAGEAARLIVDEQWDLTFSRLLPALRNDPSRPLRWLPIEARMANALARHGYQTIAHLLPLTIGDLFDLRNVGFQSVERAIHVLAREAADMAVQAATAPAADTLDALLAQVGDPNLAAQIRAAVGAPDGDEPGAELNHISDGPIQTRANNMAEQYRNGISLEQIAAEHRASVTWVQHTIIRYSDWEFPELAGGARRRPVDPSITKAAKRNAAALAAAKAKREAKDAARAEQVEANRQRAQKMAAQLAQPGMTLAAVGALHGITRERVRQIVNEHNGQTVPEIRQVRKDAEQAAEQERCTELATAALEWSLKNPGVSLEVAATELGTDANDVWRALGNRAGMHWVRNSHSQKLWTDADILDLLRAWHAETGDTDGLSFEEWGKTHNAPTRQVAHNRFGGWNLALQHAGVSDTPPLRHARKYTDNDLWAALVEFVDADRRRYSYDGFEQWQKTVPGAPSGALLRVRLQLKWSELRITADQAAHNPGMLDAAWVADVTTRRDWAAFPSGAMTAKQAVDHVKVAIAALGPDLTLNLYRDWATDNARPAYITLLRAADLTWSELVVAAGGTQPDPWRSGWTDSQILTALVAFMDDCPHGRIADYEKWSVGHDERPGLGTVYRRLGKWTTAKKMAAAAAAEGAAS